MVTLFKTLNYIFIGLFYATIVQSEALAVEDIFNVDLSKDARGGCGSVGRDRLQSLLDEAEALAAMGLELMDDYNTAGESTRLLNVFVRNNNADHRKNIRCTSTLGQALHHFHLLPMSLVWLTQILQPNTNRSVVS